MKKFLLSIIILSTFIFLGVGCDNSVSSPDADKNRPSSVRNISEQMNKSVDDTIDMTDSVGIANPASVFCEENGGKLEMITEQTGVYGVCKFTDGSECEEWDFFRGQCDPSSEDLRPKREESIDDDEDPRPDKIDDNRISCQISEDCIPLPSECHPISCINKKFENNFEKPDVCTEIFMMSAAYSPEACECRSGYCENKNLEKGVQMLY